MSDTRSEVTADRQALLRALKTIRPAVETARRSSPVLRCVRVGHHARRLTFSATDLSLWAETTVEDATTRGSAARRFVWLRPLSDALKAFTTPEVTLGFDADAELTITAGDASLSLRCIEPDDEPTWPKMDKAAEVKIDPAPIRTASVFASGDDARPILTAVLLEAERVAATDSYRLAVVDAPGGPTEPILFPARAARLLPDEPFTAHYDGDHLAWEDGPTRWCSWTVEGEFPNIDGFLPKSGGPASIAVDKDALLAALRIVRVAASDAAPVRLAPDGARLMVSAETIDRAAASVPVGAACSGTWRVLALNPEYLVSVLDACPSEQVTLEFAPGGDGLVLKPVVVRDGAFLGLLMPVRVP